MMQMFNIHVFIQYTCAFNAAGRSVALCVCFFNGSGLCFMPDGSQETIIRQTPWLRAVCAGMDSLVLLWLRLKDILRTVLHQVMLLK